MIPPFPMFPRLPRYFDCTYAIAAHKDEVNVLSTMPRIPETDMMGSISKIWSPSGNEKKLAIQAD
jgi:hypothetical protein